MGAVTAPLLPDVVWPGESARNSCLSPPDTRCTARCSWFASALFNSTLAKHGGWMPLHCSGSTAMVVPWSDGFVAPKTNTKYPRLHYARNLALTILRQSQMIKSVTTIPGTIMRGRPKRRGLNMWRTISVYVAWLALTGRTDMHGEPLFDVVWCCQHRWMGHGQHPNLKMETDGWMPSVYSEWS